MLLSHVITSNIFTAMTPVPSPGCENSSNCVNSIIHLTGCFCAINPCSNALFNESVKLKLLDLSPRTDEVSLLCGKCVRILSFHVFANKSNSNSLSYQPVSSTSSSNHHNQQQHQQSRSNKNNGSNEFG